MKWWPWLVTAATFTALACDSVPSAYQADRPLGTTAPGGGGGGEGSKGGNTEADVADGDRTVSGSETGGGEAMSKDSVPPTTGFNDLEAWLATGAYKSWVCEASPHAARANSAHVANRICNNPSLAAAGAGAFPAGAAAVKELWSGDGARLLGYAVSVHVVAGSAGDSWYWYERYSANGGEPAERDVYFSGRGASICQSCHAQAGTGGRSGHDYVYTQVAGDTTP